MEYFGKHGYPSYALSLRGHGESWKPGFVEMVFLTSKIHMAEDLSYAFTWIEAYEAGMRALHLSGGTSNTELVLVGHSAGGGVAQYFLGKNMGTVSGLVIMASFPSWGG